jgi:hypothetical protein
LTIGGEKMKFLIAFITFFLAADLASAQNWSALKFKFYYPG